MRAIKNKLVIYPCEKEREEIDMAYQAYVNDVAQTASAKGIQLKPESKSRWLLALIEESLFGKPFDVE